MLGTVSTASPFNLLHSKASSSRPRNPARKVCFRPPEACRGPSTTTTEPSQNMTSFFGPSAAERGRGPPSPVGPISRPLPSATFRTGEASEPATVRAGGGASPTAFVRAQSAGSRVGGTGALSRMQSSSQRTSSPVSLGLGSFRPHTQGTHQPRPPSSSTSQRISRIGLRPRPKTTSSVSQRRKRLLGAELYPALQKADEEREKALFRSSIGLLCQLLGNNQASLLRSPSWVSAEPSSLSSREAGDSFCRASKAESRMNNADVAKVFHVIPQRVVSARGNGRQGVNVPLQQLNQTLCMRHSPVRKSVATSGTAPTSNVDNSSGETSDKRGYAPQRNTRSPQISAQSRNFISPNDRDTPRSVDDDAGEGGSGRWFRSPGYSLSPRALSQQSVRGVECQQHSTEWTAESRMKTEESVTILSQQLGAMIPEEQQDEVQDASSAVEEEKTSGKAAFPGRLFNTPSLTNLPSYELTTMTDEEPQAPVFTEGAVCMKTMQCEVLGPYACADCTKIRQHEHQQMEQMSLYPGLTVDPRILVAPARLRTLTATLPSTLTSQRHHLDCGCAIRMHQDFLFPVLVTDHEVHSRLRAARAGCAVGTRLVRSPEGSGDTPFLLNGRRSDFVRKESTEADERKEEDSGDNEDVDTESVMMERAEEGEEKTPMSPGDMKVTVRYTSPLSDQKSVFITSH